MKIHAYSSKHYVAEFNGDGYDLTYDDGYKSKVPSSVFDRDFRSSGFLTFGDALTVLKKGGKVCRSGWNGKGMWLALQVPDAHSKMSLPYIYMKTVDDKLVPWLASQTDVLAEDWCVLDGD
jgi:hypothetical protein